MYRSSASINRTRAIESSQPETEPDEPRAAIAQRTDKTFSGSVAEGLRVKLARRSVRAGKNQPNFGVRIPRAWKLHNVYTGAKAATATLSERDNRPAGWE